MDRITRFLRENKSRKQFQSFDLPETKRGHERVFFSMEFSAFNSAFDYETGIFDSARLENNWSKTRPFIAVEDTHYWEGKDRAMKGAAEQALFIKDNPRDIPELRDLKREDFKPIVFSGTLEKDHYRYLRDSVWSELNFQMRVDVVFFIQGVNRHGEVEYVDITSFTK